MIERRADQAAGLEQIEGSRVSRFTRYGRRAVEQFDLAEEGIELWRSMLYRTD